MKKILSFFVAAAAILPLFAAQIKQSGGTISATNGKLKVSSEPKNIDGGFILAYGDIEINCSFDALISEKIDVIKDTLNKIIFA